MGKRPFLLITFLSLAGLAGFIAIAAPFHGERDAAPEWGPTIAASEGPIELSLPDAVPTDSASTTSSSSTTDEAQERAERERKLQAEEDARARGQPGTRQAPVSTRPGGPGGSQLYNTGSSRVQRLNLQLLLTSGLDQETKLLENERSTDVADKRGTIVGAIAGVTTATISGWAYDWNDLTIVAQVDIFVDGTFIQTVPSNGPRPFDPANPQNPINQTAWVCPSPPSLGNGQQHSIVALGYDPGSSAKTALQGSPWTFGGSQYPQAQLVYASPTLLYGWASDPNNPAAPVTVSVGGDGNSLTKITTTPGQNAAVFAQAQAAAPSKKSVVQLDGLTGPNDPNLGTVLAAKVQAIQQANHYLDMRPLAAAGTNVAYDEYDFVASVVSSDPVSLPGTERAAVKFWQIGDGQQAWVFVPAQPLTASWIQVQVTSSDGSMTRDAQGSPQQISGSTNRLPYGGVTFVSSTQISGWAVDPDVLPSAIAVDVVIDGTYFGRIQANQMFAALSNSVPVDPQHAFIAPPSQDLDGTTHRIQFFGVNQPDGVNPELSGSPCSFTGQRNNPPQGWLDAANPQIAGGWAYDPDAGANPIQVEVWVDNVLYQTVTANQSRPDLVPIVAPEPTHGWTLTMPASLSDGKFHSVRAFGINVPSGPKQELAGSPKEINAQQPLIGIWVKDTAQGLQISNVTAGQAGAIAGLAAGDIIRAYDGNTTQLDYSAFIAWVQTKEVGEQVVFRLWRDPSLTAPPTPNPTVPSTQATPPLGSGERLVIVTLGSK